MASNNEKTETSENVFPAAPPQSIGSLASAFKLWAKNTRLNLDVCVPAMVTEYDRTTHTAFVQPILNKMVIETGEWFSQTPVMVTVWRYQIGGFLIDAPLFKGETGWLIASDRSAIAAKESNNKILEKTTQDKGEEDEKNTGACNITDGDEDTHCLTTGFFIPDHWGDISFTDGYEDSLIIKQLDKDNNTKGEITISSTGEVRQFGRTIDEGVGKAYDMTMKVNGKESTFVKETKTYDKDQKKVGAATETEKFVYNDDDGIKYTYDGSNTDKIREQEMITAIRYDTETYQLQKKIVTHKILGDVVVGVSEESDWIMIDGGQAEQIGDESEGSGGSESPSS